MPSRLACERRARADRRVLQLHAEGSVLEGEADRAVGGVLRRRASDRLEVDVRRRREPPPEEAAEAGGGGEVVAAHADERGARRRTGVWADGGDGRLVEVGELELLADIAASAVQRELYQRLVASVRSRRAAVDTAMAAQPLERSRHLASLALSEAANKVEAA